MSRDKKIKPRQQALKGHEAFMKAFTPALQKTRANTPRANFDIAEMRQVLKDKMKPHRKV